MKNALKVVIFTVLFFAVAVGGVFGFYKYNKTDFYFEEAEEKGSIVINSYIGKSVNIDIPEKIRGKKVVAVGQGAFEDKKIKSVIIPDTVKEIGMAAFKGCTELESVTIKGGVESIGENAFNNCDKLTEFTFPAELKTIGSLPFADCDGLKTINTEQNGNFVFEDGILYSADKATAYFALNSTDLSKVKLPAEVKNFAPFFFFKNDKITSFELPDGIKVIDTSLFALCSKLKEVKIPDSVESIKSSAFVGCTSLDKLYIPANVKNIDKFCFPVPLETGSGKDKEQSEDLFNPDFTLVVEKDSAAHTYAKEHSIKYELAK